MRTLHVAAQRAIDALRVQVYELTSERDALRNEVNALRARVAELEAPPVVPVGWAVRRTPVGGWQLYAMVDGRECMYSPALSAMDRMATRSTALRALVWAIEHDRRPPHAGDNPSPVADDDIRARVAAMEAALASATAERDQLVARVAAMEAALAEATRQ